MKRLPTLALIACIFSGVAAHAQDFTGGFGIGGSGTYSSANMSISISSTEVYEDGDGTFANLSFGLVSVTNTSIGGFTGTGNSVTLSAPLPTFEISSTTSPANEYAFDITSVTPEGSGVYKGTGEFIDNTGLLTTTAATFTMSFAGGPDTTDGYSFSASAVPEPTTWLMMLGGLVLLGVRVHRNLA